MYCKKILPSLFPPGGVLSCTAEGQNRILALMNTCKVCCSRFCTTPFFVILQYLPSFDIISLSSKVKRYSIKIVICIEGRILYEKLLL